MVEFVAYAMKLAEEIAGRYAQLPEVHAVVLGGSLGYGNGGAGSDIDLYVYSRSEIAPAQRAKIALARTETAEINNRFWEPGDEWIEGDPPTGVDVMYRTPGWIEGQLERVLGRCEASVGYSTCFWHNVLNSRALYDPHGWYAALQRSARVPYPEALQQAIVDKNHPILRDTFSSYRHQLERAVERGDLVSVNHRVAEVLSSYFDVVFAVNKLPHPGEKRLVEIAKARCEKLPAGFPGDVEALLRAAGSGSPEVLELVDFMDSELDGWLMEEGLFLGRQVWTHLDSQE